ncbi:ParB/RepB/Spo0J family partition protein [uncultured Arcanobacterium sp.]|uniref:ParB/RepB/Spo0J family partition protein n=1 Tax=uncultured Arcanobacterium sp. TaxID=487520 RepID=UPI0026239C91|nr:ParB/RepB/Spo0J family partition protein [uncultured Arcanobacterium sp.]
MREKRRGLGRGIGALIPDSQGEKESPIDVFFSSARPAASANTATEGITVKNSAGKNTGGAAKNKVSENDAPDISVTGDKKSVKKAASGKKKTNEVSAAQTGAASAEKARKVSKKYKNVSRETDTSQDLVPVPGATYGEIALDQIIPNTKQPRQVFDEDELDELALSIKEVGVLQPIVVRPLAERDASHPQARYELIMGERRWRASLKAGKKTVPAIVRHTEDADLLRDALLENLHRAQLNPLEEAAAYQQLLDDFQCTQEELSKRIAKSRPQISNTLRLLKLPPLVQRRVAAGVLSAGHARALLGLNDPAAMERLAQQIVAEGLSVRATEEKVTLSGEEKLVTPRRPQQVDPELATWAQELGDYLDTRVKIVQGIRKGKITIEFASVEDLQRILEIIGAGK